MTNCYKQIMLMFDASTIATNKPTFFLRINTSYRHIISYCCNHLGEQNRVDNPLAVVLCRLTDTDMSSRVFFTTNSPSFWDLFAYLF